MLEAGLKSGYRFLSFSEGERAVAGGTEDRICLLRHDIDADLEAAVEMAVTEARAGVSATYFLMLRSPVYNLLSRHNHRFVEQLIDNGHTIGLHYDAAFQPRDKSTLNEHIEKEAHAIETYFNVAVDAVSFHQPGENILNQEVQVERLINTYDKKRLGRFHYLSDSNRVWKEEHPLTVFREALHPRLHLLIHPMWWRDAYENRSTEEVWTATLHNNLDKMQDQLCATERAYGNRRTITITEENPPA